MKYSPSVAGNNTSVNLQQGTSQTDAFGKLRVTQPHTIFDSKQIFDNSPIFWDEELVSGAGISSAYSKPRASTTLTSTLNTAGSFIRQTFQSFNYQPGKSQLIYMTGIIGKGTHGTGTESIIGQIDDNNGIAFVLKEGVMYARIRSSVSGVPVDTDIPQSQWSEDKLDGTGASGLTADWSKIQIFTMDCIFYRKK